jgi:acetylornithine deacetylase/succinyl-diaminopimelate desuccinylase-like protein
MHFRRSAGELCPKGLVMRGVKKAVAWAAAHRRDFVADLAEFVRFPSVSAQPAHAQDLRRCASWLAARLQNIGLDNTRVIETAGHPLVYAEWLRRPDAPVILIYGHYDVQPPEPLADWTTPPFQPRIRSGRLYGRGASDDKGQMLVHIQALRAWLATNRALPVNVRCLFEGEEETGSANLLTWIDSCRSELQADGALISDAPMAGPDEPAITYGLRGALSVEVEVQGAVHDLHSGVYGGAVLNPLQAVCRFVAQLQGANGTVQLPGFYDQVRPVSREERLYLKNAGPGDREFLASAGARVPSGEHGYTLYERVTFRPALTVNGVIGGYTGPGAKAVIPAKASVKLNFRLVPDQDPNQIDRALRRYVSEFFPQEISARVRTDSVANPVVLGWDAPIIRAADEACRETFGKPPRLLRMGGTIPVVSSFQRVLGIPTALLGFALPEDALHAPNESFRLGNFFRAIETSIRLFDAAARIMGRPGARGRSVDTRVLQEATP